MKRYLIVLIVFLCAQVSPALCDLTSKDYVDRIISAGNFEKNTNKVSSVSDTSTDEQYPSARALYSHVSDTENPHSVTKAQVGLSNVQNVDQTNASNLTSGTVAYERLPIGSAANTIAAGDDLRFWAVPNAAALGAAPAGWSWIWIEP